ncbi:MAG: hypothetical protein ACKOTA_01465, partial [Solirubrobacterales bacterium]
MARAIARCESPSERRAQAWAVSGSTLRATGEGPAMREAAEDFARAALEGQFASAPWDALLEPA